MGLTDSLLTNLLSLPLKKMLVLFKTNPKNKIINKEKKVIGALRRAKSSLKENESAKMFAIRGSQEYQNVKKSEKKCETA